VIAGLRIERRTHEYESCVMHFTSPQIPTLPIG
jgi:hypothetical protein